MAISLKTSVNILPNSFGCCERFDATHVLAAGNYSYIGGGDQKVYIYSWNGSVFTPISSTPLSGGENSGFNMKVRSGFIYRDGSGTTVASGAAVAQVQWNGSAFVNFGYLYYYMGMTGMGPGDWRGAVYGYDGDGTYMYVCGRQWTLISPPPPDYVSGYKYTLDALLPGVTPVLKKNLVITLADCGLVLCHGGFIYLVGSSATKRYTFNGSDYTLVQTHALIGLQSSDGTYIYAKSGTSIIAYSSTLSSVASLDTLVTVSSIRSSGGYIFVAHALSTEVYTFNGISFTLVDASVGQIVQAFI